MKKLLIAVIIFGIALAATYSNLAYITDWGSAELVGYNAWTLIVWGIAAYLIYRFTVRKTN